MKPLAFDNLLPCMILFLPAGLYLKINLSCTQGCCILNLHQMYLTLKDVLICFP